MRIVQGQQGQLGPKSPLEDTNTLLTACECCVQVALAALLLAAAASAQPPKPGPAFRAFVDSLSKVVAAEGSQLFQAPPATVETGARLLRPL